MELLILQEVLHL